MTARIVCSVVLAVSCPSLAAAPSLPPVPTNFSIQGDAAIGKPIFMQVCSVCHGAKGKGDGVAGMSLRPKPTNFTDAAVMARISDWEMFVVVKNGGPAAGKSPLMAAYGTNLTEHQIHDVLTYVRSLNQSVATLPDAVPGTTTSPPASPASTGQSTPENSIASPRP
jgi:mono/diheme cytochrome c family protein